MVLGAGFGCGAWRAGKSARSLLKSAVLLPIILLALTAMFCGYLLYAAGQGDSFAALGAASVLVLGVIFSLLALTGGFFGAWYRRAGGRQE